MWSDRHYYLNIYKDKNLSSFVKTEMLIRFLDSIPELTKTDHFTYKNSSIDISLLFAEHADSWSADNNMNQEKTNLIAIVCAKGDHVDFEKSKTLLIKIATFLNWQLVDEQTDNEIEDFVLWTPTNDNKT